MAGLSSLVPSTRIHVKSSKNSPPQPHLCKPCTKAILSARGTWGRKYIESIQSKLLRFLGKGPEDPYSLRSRKSISYACRPWLDDGCFVCWHIARQHRQYSMRLEDRASLIKVRSNFWWGPETVSFEHSKSDQDYYPLYFSCLSAKGKSAFNIDALEYGVNIMPDYSVLLSENPGLFNTISSDTWSPSTAELARSWLKKCLSDHGLCARPLGHPDIRTLPKRIVRIEKDTAHRLSARLLLSENLPPDFQYLTLSHCWGTLQFTTLTMGNCNDFFQRIPVGDVNFNKTFRDAFNVTLDLGYEYIWIDSLCIIQDSPGAADWNEECPQVGHIYANGVCNLSATGFENGALGMITERNTQYLSPCPVKIPFHPLKYLIPKTVPFMEAKTEHPLISRGWVLQEHVLVSITTF